VILITGITFLVLLRFFIFTLSNTDPLEEIISLFYKPYINSHCLYPGSFQFGYRYFPAAQFQP
jgi:hypothetical protein